MGILSLLSQVVINQQCSLYAIGAILFASSNGQDLSTTKENLSLFASAHGLHTNLQNSAIVPISC